MAIPMLASEVEALDRIGGILEKQRRRRRVMQSYRRELREQEKKFLTPVREWMALLQKELRAGLSRMKGKTAAARTRSIADWKELEAQGVELMKPALFAVLNVGGNRAFGQKIRKQERFDPIGVEAVGWTNEHAAALVVEVTDKTMAAIRVYIADGIDKGKSIPALARELRPLVGLTEKQIIAVANYHEMLILERPEYTAATQRKMADIYARKLHRRRAETIARTETAAGLAEGQRQGYAQMGVKRLERVEDPECCDICADHQGQIYTIAEAEGVLPEHPNCLLGDSFVSPCGNITGISKRWFEGKIVIFETASSRKLSCTPHHPVLTDIGFCPADSLNVGSKVVCHGVGQGERFADWYNINKPSTIKKIVNSFLKSDGVTTNRMPTSAMDFHGDGGGSKITIISSNRFLVRGFNPPLQKHSLKLDLIMRKIRRSFLHCFCMFAFRLPAYRSSFGRNMRRISLAFALTLRHFFPYNFDPLRLASDSDVILQQSLTNNMPAHIEKFSDLFFRAIRNIHADNLANGKDIMFEFPDCISFPWYFDNIIHKEISVYKGYVYNLETSKSYYIANGIATHNCEGSWVAAE